MGRTSSVTAPVHEALWLRHEAFIKNSHLPKRRRGVIPVKDRTEATLSQRLPRGDASRLTR
jgi:hypothetical protein